MSYYKYANTIIDTVLTVGGLNWFILAVRKTGHTHEELMVHDLFHPWAPHELALTVYYIVGIAGILKTLMLGQMAMSNYCCDLKIQFVDDKSAA